MTIAKGHSRLEICMKCKSPEAAQHLANTLIRKNPKWIVEVNDKQVSVELMEDMSIAQTFWKMIE